MENYNLKNKSIEKTEAGKKVTVYEAFWYFVIFSILGLIIETIFCYVRNGIIESRKGLLWGPFCPIYGVGGVALILFLEKYKDNDFKIFVYGGLIGGIIEYVISFLLEALYGSRFWDYSQFPFNLNGRICITYTIYWAILSLILMKIIKPSTAKAIKIIPKRVGKIAGIILTIFLVVDAIITVWATAVYKNRALDIYYNREPSEKADNILTDIEENYFTNVRMYETFPKLRVRDESGNDLFVSDILKEAGKL